MIKTAEKKKSVDFTFLLTVLIVMLLLSCSSGSQREQISVAFTDDLFEAVKPVFSIPEKDKDNSIETVLVAKRRDKNMYIFEVTVVFTDEDHPSGFIDFMYDIYRGFRYGRARDIETFYMYFDTDRIRLSYLNFPDVYSGDQTFGTADVVHQSAEIDAGSFEFAFQSSRPVVYINTWNHMFSEKNNNPEMKEQLIANYTVLAGTREDAETLY